MLNPEFKLKWTEALRNGPFEQTAHNLQDQHGFCCLGVACELLKEELKLEVVTDDGDLVSYNGELAVLPQVVCKHIGLDNDYGFYIDADGQQQSLVGDNDCGKTFSEIAAIIDKYF